MQKNWFMLLLFVGLISLDLNIHDVLAETKENEFLKLNLASGIKPQSIGQYLEIVAVGHINNYTRGTVVSILVVNPDQTYENLSTYATRDGDVYALIHFTEKSQVGIYKTILMYENSEIASAIFELIDKQ